jgi:hypothetical protein
MDTNTEEKQGEPKRLVFGKTGQEASQKEDTPRPITIKDAIGDETDVVFMIVGTLSKRYKKAQTRNRAQWGRKAAGGDELDQQAREATAACVVSWNGIVDQDGAAVPCTPDNVAQLLDEMPWVREQLDGEIRDHAAFFTKRSTP